MAIGQPDLVLSEGERSPSDPSGLPPAAFVRESWQSLPPHESYPERLIREAIEAGEFDDLAGTGEPIPGRGTTDDDLWWVRDWVRRNSVRSQESSSSE